MNLRRLVLAVLVAALLLMVVVAQTPRRPPASRPAAPKPSATPTPATVTPAPAADPASPVLATVGNTSILASEIEADVSAAIMRDPDPYLQDYYADPAKAVREARARAVDARVASMLIAAEAKKHGKLPNDIIEAEVNAKVGPPSEQDIQAAYNANRSQLGGADLESVRPDLVNFLRNQQKQTLYSGLVT